MDIVTDNIANVETTGFKRDTSVTRPFSEELLSRLDDPEDKKYDNTNVGRMSFGIFIDDVITDFSAGGFRHTGTALDLALSGTGFFAVSTADRTGQSGVKYTRDGSFSLGSDGLLMTTTGNPVLGQDGMIRIPAGEISIDEDGSIYSNDVLVDKIRIVDFSNPQELRKQQDNLFEATNRALEIGFAGTVNSGFLENSNVSPIHEMVDMISISRIYDTNQRMIQVHDTILNRTVNDVGRKL
jgi:flagellar basal-body rod protein FlgG